MSGDKSKLNGSVGMLAQAMRQVFREAVEEGTAPLRKDVSGLKTDMKRGFKEAAEERGRLRSDMESGFKDAAEERERLRGEIDRLDTDMQNGFAELKPPAE